MRAIMDRVIVKRSAAEAQRGRIVLALQNEPDSGTVVSVGPGKLHPKTGERIPLGIAPNDVVYFDRGAGQPLDENGEHYLVLTPEAIIGIAEIETPASRKFQEAVARMCA